MRIDFSHNYAEASKRDNGTFFIKLSFPEVGLYVNGIRVVPSKQNIGEYVVYKPKIMTVGRGWKTNYEFSNDSELWLYLQELALKSVNEYDVTHNFDDIDDIDIGVGLDQAIKDFGLEDKPP